MSDRLFDTPSPMDQNEPLSADRRRTLRQQAAIANGRNPATGLRFIPDHQCRECVHAVRVHNGNRSHWKCTQSKLGLTHSAASDIRISWPACELFVEVER